MMGINLLLKNLLGLLKALIITHLNTKLTEATTSQDQQNGAITAAVGKTCADVQNTTIAQKAAQLQVCSQAGNLPAGYSFTVQAGVQIVSIALSSDDSTATVAANGATALEFTRANEIQALNGVTPLMYHREVNMENSPLDDTLATNIVVSGTSGKFDCSIVYLQKDSLNTVGII